MRRGIVPSSFLIAFLIVSVVAFQNCGHEFKLIAKSGEPYEGLTDGRDSSPPSGGANTNRPAVLVDPDLICTPPSAPGHISRIRRGLDSRTMKEAIEITYDDQKSVLYALPSDGVIKLSLPMANGSVLQTVTLIAGPPLRFEASVLQSPKAIKVETLTCE